MDAMGFGRNCILVDASPSVQTGPSVNNFLEGQQAWITLHRCRWGSVKLDCFHNENSGWERLVVDASRVA